VSTHVITQSLGLKHFTQMDIFSAKIINILRLIYRSAKFFTRKIFNYYSKTKGLYFRIIIKLFKIFSQKISQIGKTTFI